MDGISSLYALSVDYIVGYAQLFVYINGIKQYSNERAYQIVQVEDVSAGSPALTSPAAISWAISTGWTSSNGNTYSFTVTVDGGSPHTVNVVAANNPTFGDLVQTINLSFAGSPAAGATVDFTRTGLIFRSDTSGVGSSISVVDVDLFVNLTGGGGSPPISTPYNIVIDTANNITTNLGFAEVGPYGSISNQINFTTTRL